MDGGRNGRHTDRATAPVGERRGVSVAWFAAFWHEAVSNDADRAWLDPLLAAKPAVLRALSHLPSSIHDPYLDDCRPPAPVLQLCFADVAGLNAARGHLQILATPDALRSLFGAAATQRGLRARALPVPEPRQSPAMCSYPAAYEGKSDDLDARVTHYTTHRTAIMAHFPHIRETEVGTRPHWRGALSWQHGIHVLRSKVVFDNPARLTAALNAPLPHDMRADDATFRKFTGPVTHFPMHTAVVERSRFIGAVVAPRRGG